MDFKDLLEYSQAEAIASFLSADEVSVWRSICRSYSKKFSTPLHLCLDGTIPPEDILLAEYEDQLEKFKIEDNLEVLLDKIYMLIDPDYEREKKVELESFIKRAEKEEEERIRKGKPIHKAMKGEPTLSTMEDEVKEQKPSQGYIDLSYLEKEENPDFES
jgi:hypothetical protein